jgi:hypothetical protein
MTNMETYQAKNVNKQDIDNVVKIIYNKFQQEKPPPNTEFTRFIFAYELATITLNNIKFRFKIYCQYLSEQNQEFQEFWELRCIILNDNYLNYEEYLDKRSERINFEYFMSDTLRELIVKYINTEFVYDKYDNKIMRYDDYLQIQSFRKLFHSNIECCVCYDNIAGDFKTKCGHYLCVDCYSQIKGKKVCPMCKICLCCGSEPEEESDEED